MKVNNEWVLFVKKYFFTLFLVPALAFSNQEKPSPPKIPGFKAIEAIYGDLNNDNLSDMAVLYQGVDEKKITKNEAGMLGADEFDENPRKIVIYFNNNQQFVKVAENSVPPEGSREGPCVEDPYRGMTIKNNKLQISFGFWTSCGSWSTSATTYTFRFEPKINKFRLIGKDYRSLKRNTGEGEEESVNYLTGKIKNTSGLNEFVEKENKPQIEWSKLNPNPVITFGDFSFE